LRTTDGTSGSGDRSLESSWRDGKCLALLVE
jgi:hypothetical protein